MAVAALAVPAGAQAFTPNDPLAPKQWYLTQDKTFDACRAAAAATGTVRVGVIDSGIDARSPGAAVADRRRAELRRRHRERRPAGTAPSSPARSPPRSTTARHRRYRALGPAADRQGRAPTTAPSRPPPRRRRSAGPSTRGARVDQPEPRRRPRPAGPAAPTVSRRSSSARSTTPSRRARSSSRRSATARRGADDAVAVRELPGRAAARARRRRSFGRDGDVPGFSNRDDRLQRPRRARRGHLLDSPARADLRRTRPASTRATPTAARRTSATRSGTSFAAAAGVGRRGDAVRASPGPAADQVSELLEHAATPTRRPRTAAATAWPGRDALSGWGMLDIAAAVAALRSARLPRPDRFEPNDDVGARHAAIRRAESARARRRLDYWDDRNDVYRDQAPSAASGSASSRRLATWTSRSCSGSRGSQLVEPAQSSRAARPPLGARPRREGAAPLPAPRRRAGTRRRSSRRKPGSQAPTRSASRRR